MLLIYILKWMPFPISQVNSKLVLRLTALLMNFKFYSLVFYPTIDTHGIDSFRAKYDFLADVIKPHITLIFPVRIPTDIHESDLLEHIQQITDTWKKFEIRIQGLELSWDNWLFLTVSKGNQRIIELHDALYSEQMNSFWRKDIGFIPHVAIGIFTKNSERYDLKDPKRMELDKRKFESALKEAQELDIGYDCMVEKLSLVKLNSGLTDCELVKEFNLT